MERHGREIQDGRPGKLDDAAKDAAWAEIEEKLTAFNTASGWEGPNELLLTTGRK